jgi:hypothetical protein
MKLQASPAASGTPKFSFGCGKSDGTSSCDLGAVDPESAHRQLQAQLTVPVIASAVKSVSLTVTGTSTQLPKAAKASVAVAITAPGTPAATQPALAGPPPAPLPPLPPPLPPMTVTSPLPVGSLPGIPSVGPVPPVGPVPTQSQAGSAAGLFPAVSPSPTPGSTGERGAIGMADTSALPEGASVVSAQLAGLAALALAFVLAVTRLSIRRPAKQSDSQPGTESGPDTETDGGHTANGKKTDADEKRGT